MAQIATFPEFVSTAASKSGVEVHADLTDWPDSGDAIAVSSLASALAVHSCQAGLSQVDGAKAPRLTASTGNQFSAQGGDRLIAKAAPIKADGTHHIWRAEVYRADHGDDLSASTLIADYSNSFVLEDASDSSKKSGPPDVSNRSNTASDSSSPFDKKPRSEMSTAEKRRNQIFEGACTVIGKKGFGAASIRDIAKEAKVSIPMMYQYVENKEDILYLITSTCMSDIIRYFEQELANDDGAPVERLGNAVGAYIRYINDNRKYINLVYSETRALGADNREKVFMLEKKFMKLWEGLLTDGVSKGVFKVENTDLYANFIYFLCTVWSLRYWSIGHYDEDLVQREITSMVLNGILK